MGAGAEAVVVATMGRGDTEVLEAALATPAGYVGLVASAKRAGVELGRLRERGLDEAAIARVRSPAGLDLGPLEQSEIAVAVLAELVAWRHRRSGSAAELLEAVDPVCGMTVAIAAGDAVRGARRRDVLVLLRGLPRAVRRRAGGVSRRVLVDQLARHRVDRDPPHGEREADERGEVPEVGPPCKPKTASRTSWTQW